jgi:hypothetical protein
MTLEEKLVAVHESLAEASIPHAFGGAIALAYWTENPRGTSDIDVNIFIDESECARGLEALPSAVPQPPETEETCRRDGQIRLWWDGTPIDLFFDNVPVHAEAAAHRRVVPYVGTRIPILGPLELAVFKAMFDRTQDWADIEHMLVARTLDADEVRGIIESMLGEADPRVKRLDEAVERAATGHV